MMEIRDGEKKEKQSFGIVDPLLYGVMRRSGHERASAFCKLRLLLQCKLRPLDKSFVDPAEGILPSA
jgi:hypothetical protein